MLTSPVNGTGPRAGRRQEEQKMMHTLQKADVQFARKRTEGRAMLEDDKHFVTGMVMNTESSHCKRVRVCYLWL